MPDLHPARPRRSREPAPLSVAFVVPMQGSTGIWGPSCLACGELAAEELNAGAGIAGRELELVHVDAGRPSEVVAQEVGALVDAGRVDAVAGWHISAVRQAVARRIAGRVVYAFAPMHEGYDDTPGVVMLGERPSNQLLPATHWMRQHHGVARWAVIGNDYVFPRVTGRTTRQALRGTGSSIVAERYVPLGTTDFSTVLDDLGMRELDGAIMLLMGNDAVRFNRQFAAAGLDERLPRLSPAVEENALLAGGADAHHGLYAAAAYFDSLATEESGELAERYYRRFGEYAPALNAVGESCYEAIHFLGRLAREAGSVSVAALEQLGAGYFYESPRGLMRFDGNLVDQDVYVAAADGLEFRVEDQIARTG